jgi:hypothetical protein
LVPDRRAGAQPLKRTPLTSNGIPTGATSSPIGNGYGWGGLRFDAETGLHNDDGGGYVEPQSGSTLARAQDDLQRTGNPAAAGMAIRGRDKVVKVETSAFAAKNPWTGGPPNAMQKGTVKWFNDGKGFGAARLLESIQDEAKGFSSLIR